MLINKIIINAYFNAYKLYINQFNIKMLKMTNIYN